MGSEGRIMLRDLVTEMIKLIWGILTSLPLRFIENRRQASGKNNFRLGNFIN